MKNAGFLLPGSWGGVSVTALGTVATQRKQRPKE